MRKTAADEETDDIAAAEGLANDDELVIENTNTKRIRKERRPRADTRTPLPALIDLDDDDDDDGPDGEIFPEGSIGRRLSQSDDERLLNTQCSIKVVRKPDTPGERFAKPCVSRMSEPPLRNIDLSTPESDIEEIVRANYLGGHYYLQIQIGNTFHAGWDCDLADPPDAAARLKAANTSTEYTPPPPAAPPAAVVNPIDSFLESAGKFKAMRDALFGEKEEELKTQIADLKAEVAAAKANPAEPKSERLILLEEAMKAPTVDLQTRLLGHLFPVEETGSRHWAADVFQVALENRDTIFALVGPLFGSLLGIPQQPQPQPEPSIADLMRSQPPGGLPPQQPPPERAVSRFQRRRVVMESDNPVAGNAGVPPAHDAAAEVVADDDSPPVPVSAFIDQPEPLPLTSEGMDQIDTSTDDAAIDAEEVPLQKPARSKGTLKKAATK